MTSGRRRLLFFVGAILLVLAGGEIFSRRVLGLGSPPLSITDPVIEYMFAPNQDVKRFGNRQIYNAYGMRNENFDVNSRKRKILVLGDSVINGGNLTDQSELATEIASDDDRIFGNVSAGSWGPQNMAAWFNKYGPLGSDTAIVVISSHDLNDLPTFAPLNPNTHPTQQPVSALLEGIQRYLLRYIPSFLKSKKPTDEPAFVGASPSGPDAVSNLFETLGVSGLRVCLVQHLTLQEIESEPEPGNAIIRQIADDYNIPNVALANRLRSRLDRGENPFYDNIHLNPRGQIALAAALDECDDLARKPDVMVVKE